MGSDCRSLRTRPSPGSTTTALWARTSSTARRSGTTQSGSNDAFSTRAWGTAGLLGRDPARGSCRSRRPSLPDERRFRTHVGKAAFARVARHLFYAAWMDYPVAERQDIVDELFGHRIADPYRWLEDASTAQTAEWLGYQDDLARPYLDSLPGRERLRTRLTELLGTGVVGGPAWRGSRYFFVRRNPGQEPGSVLVREAN